MAAELHEPDVDVILRLPTTKLEEWATYYRIQEKAREKDQQNAEATAARRRAEQRLSRSPVE